jgi:hypothetical protein
MASAFNLVLAVTVLAPGLGCVQNSSGWGFDFNDEAERVQRLTISAGGQTLERHPVVRTPRANRANRQDWRVSTEMPWTSYSKEVTRTLEPSYHCGARSETRTACVRQLPGDLLQLELVAEPAIVGLHVRISLKMHPD